MDTRHHDKAAQSVDDMELDFQPSGTIGELGSELAADDEASPHYLRAQWIAQTISMLRYARYESGLSQKDVADALGTRQPAIARLERSEDITLGRIWDYLRACGMEPLPLQSVCADGSQDESAQRKNGTTVRTTGASVSPE